MRDSRRFRSLPLVLRVAAMRYCNTSSLPPATLKKLFTPALRMHQDAARRVIIGRFKTNAKPGDKSL